MRKIALTVVCGVLVTLAASTLRADITFNFTYADVASNTGFGFDDGAEGVTRRATVEAVADYINTVVDHDGTVDIEWDLSINNPGSGTLASMGSFYFGNSGVTNGFVFDHATTGVDPLGGVVDGRGEVNFGRNWNSDTGAPAGNEFDLYTVVLHEITHSMGFASLFNQDGSTLIAGTRSVYDSLLEDVNGNKLLNGTDFVGDSSVFTSGNLFFDANGDKLEMHAPANFNGGSSISHFDLGFPGANVMFPTVAPGVTRRVYSENDLAVLEAIGWNLKGTAVPEPSGFVFATALLLGIGYRKRRKSPQNENAEEESSDSSAA